MNRWATICTLTTGLVLVAACKPAPDEQAASNDGAAHESPAEIEEGHWCSAECRAEVREAARQYVAKATPGAVVNGISTKAIDDEEAIWLATVDSGATQPPIELVVRFFVSESGDEYWLATPLTADLAVALNAVAVRTLVERTVEADRENRSGADKGGYDE